MALTLYFHPFSSYCQKVVIALYENATPFTPKIIDLGNPASASELKKVWPIRKFPVLRDDARGETVPESSIIVEYLDRHYPGPVKLIPADPDAALRTRQRDRFFDLYINDPMAKVVGDSFRPAGKNDPHGVAMAKEMLSTAYEILDAEMGGNSWAAGPTFTLADCAAAPMLFYANLIVPIPERHAKLIAYFSRLSARPAFQRVLKEAEPYCGGTPFEDQYRAEFRRLTGRP
jgi:glutathione S-transferase